MDDMDEMSLETAVQAILAPRRAGTEPPSPEELLSFRAGALGDGDREELLERAAGSSGTVRALLDARRFPAVEPADERQRVTEEEVARQWPRFQERLRREALLETSEAPPARPIAAAGRWLSAVLDPLRFARGLAAALLLVSLGLSWALIGRKPVPEDARPRLNLPIVELAPASEAGERAAARASRIPAAADGILVVLTLRDRRSYPVYEVELRRPSGALAWSSSDLRRAAEGIFTLALPRAFLSADRYRIELWGVDGERRDPLAVYDLAIEELDSQT